MAPVTLLEVAASCAEVVRRWQAAAICRQGTVHKHVCESTSQTVCRIRPQPSPRPTGRPSCCLRLLCSYCHQVIAETGSTVRRLFTIRWLFTFGEEIIGYYGCKPAGVNPVAALQVHTLAAGSSAAALPGDGLQGTVAFAGGVGAVAFASSSEALTAPAEAEAPGPVPVVPWSGRPAFFML